MKSNYCALMASQLKAQKKELEEQLRNSLDQSKEQEEKQNDRLYRNYDDVIEKLNTHAWIRSERTISGLYFGWKAMLVLVWTLLIISGLLDLHIAGKPVLNINTGDVLAMTFLLIVIWFLGNIAIKVLITSAITMYYSGVVKKEAEEHLNDELNKNALQSEEKRKKEIRNTQAQIRAIDARLSNLKDNYVKSYKKYRAQLSESKYMDKLSVLLIREIFHRISCMHQGDTIKIELSLNTEKMILTLIGRVKREILIELKYYDADLHNLPEESAAAALAALLYRKLDLELAETADNAVMTHIGEQNDGTIVIGICK